MEVLVGLELGFEFREVTLKLGIYILDVFEVTVLFVGL